MEVLRDQPGYETLLSALRYLSRKPGDPAAFNISRPTPQSAQMVQVLVSDIAPNYWALLQEDSAQDRGSRRESADKELFLGCLRSLAGINAILVRLRALIQKVKTDTIGGSIQGSLLSLQQTVDLLNAVLDGDGRVQQIWTSTTGEIDGAAKKKPLEQEFLAVLGGGRVVSLSAEVEQVIKQAKGFKQATQLWTPGSSDYSMWLARNIATWITQEDTSEDAKICSNLFDKALRLGHSGMPAM